MVQNIYPVFSFQIISELNIQSLTLRHNITSSETMGQCWVQSCNSTVSVLTLFIGYLEISRGFLWEWQLN